VCFCIARTTIAEQRGEVVVVEGMGGTYFVALSSAGLVNSVSCINYRTMVVVALD
jgi:hypothetical protein